MKTSPRISIRLGNSDSSFIKERGIEFIVLTLCVISSPTLPSPRVVAFSMQPFLYKRLTAIPSSLGSQEYEIASFPVSLSRIRLLKSCISSELKALSNESIGARCSTFTKPSKGSLPTL